MNRRRFLHAAGLVGLSVGSGCLRIDQQTRSRSTTVTEQPTTTSVETTAETTTEPPQCLEDRQIPSDAIGSWTQFQSDAANTGFQPEATVPTELACPAWEFRGEGRTPSPVVVEDTVIYPGSRETPRVVALDRQSGDVRWQSDKTITGKHSPTGCMGAIQDGTLYIILYEFSQPSEEQVFAIDLATGAEKWRTSFESSQTKERLRPGITITTDQIFVKSVRRMYALSLTDGTVNWTAPTDRGVFHSSPPAVGENMVVASIDDAGSDHQGGGAVAFDTRTGDRLWDAAIGRVQASPTINDGTVYIARSDGPNTLCAIDGDSGTVRWQFETLNGTSGSPAVANNRVYFGDSDNTLYAVNASDGSREWRFDARSRVSQASPVVAGNTLLVGATDSGGAPGLHAIDATTGEPYWKFETTYSVRNAPAVAGGVIYLTTTIGSLYALV